MSAEDSVTRWIAGLRAGDPLAAQRLWETFFDRLVTIARQRLAAAARTMSDEEDVVLSAIKSFCLGVQRGSFPQLQDRDDLWRLLLVITSRKVADQFAFQQRDKRDTSREVRFADGNDAASSGASEAACTRELNPEFAVECADQLEHLLAALQHDDLKQIALAKMEGHSNDEIARRLQRSLTTIERKLRTIREIWGQVDS